MLATRPKRIALAAIGCGLVASLAGCINLFQLIPVQNCGATLWPEVKITETTDTAAVGNIPELDDVRWLEVQADVETTDLSTGEKSTSARAIGGYFSPEDPIRPSLVILLSGGATLEPTGRQGTALWLYQNYGTNFRLSGYRIWVPVLSEDEPYGTREVDEAAALIDWLDAEGRALLHVTRVYVVGYSTGGTLVNFLNLRSRVDAMVSIAGLTQPDQLLENEQVDRFVAGLFDCNSALRQLERTIDFYSRVGWNHFDLPARVTELKSPMLMLTTLDDWVQWPSNTQAVETAYNDAVANGAILPPLTFEYFERGGHSLYVTGDDFVLTVLAYLEQSEALAYYVQSAVGSTGVSVEAPDPDAPN